MQTVRIGFLLGMFVCLLSLTLVPSANAINPQGFPSWRMSNSVDGGLPDGLAWDGHVSLDERDASIVSFTSTATNLVPKDDNGRVSDVFLVPRQTPYAHNGTAWRADDTILMSHAPNGGPANGPSWGTRLSGDIKRDAKCAVFLSDASNLVRGDTNGATDAFMYRWRSNPAKGIISRLSVNAAGKQANAPTTNVFVDGDCSHVTFVSSATNLALTHTTNPLWKASVTKNTHGQPAVYLRTVTDFIGAHNGVTGLTSLVSRTGKTPLSCNSDTTSISQGFDRIVVYSCGHTIRTTEAIITRASYHYKYGVVGNGDHPATNSHGSMVAYDKSDGSVWFAQLRGSRWATKRIASESSALPSLTIGGTWAFYESDLTQSHHLPDENGVRDAYLYTLNDNRTNVVSYADEGRQIAQDVHRVQSSAEGNYLMFDTTDISADSSNPLEDNWLVPAVLPGDQYSPANQVYMHWMGPK